jgi:hypothetical protein
MNLKNEEMINKINALDEFWQKKCKEFENMEISPSDAARWRARFRSQSRPITWTFSESQNNWDLTRKIDRIDQDVDIALIKGQNNFRENETRRFNEKYGKIIGPALSTITAFIYAIIAVLQSK